MEYRIERFDNNIIKDFVETGSNRSANLFVRHFQQFVYATAFRYVKQHNEADEVAQDVFIKALDSLSKFRGDSSLKSWLYRITVNTAVNHIRKQKITRLFVRDGDSDYNNILTKEVSASVKMDLGSFRNDFDDALAKLPKKQRETFALKYFENLTYEEISEMIGTSIGGLKANYFQAVKKLAQYLKEYQEIVR